jgi:hypothetical protein
VSTRRLHLGKVVSAVPASALAMFVTSAAVLTWRASTWTPSQTPDAWAYISWGQALAHGRAPLYDRTLTTPKPLGFVLGIAVSPLEPQRAFQIGVIGFLALLAAALFWLGFREGGVVGAVVAVAVLGASTILAQSLQGALVDGVVTGLVVTALVTRGRTRVATLFVVGLARPEAWVLTGIAAYAECPGDRRRRALVGVAATGAAPFVWVLVDFAFTGDLFASAHRASAILDITHGGHTSSLASLPGPIARAILTEVGVAVTVVGGLGLIAMTVRSARRHELDPLPLALVVIWSLGILAEARNLPFKARFLFPVAPSFWLGLAFLAGLLTRRWRPGGSIAAFVLASIAFAVGVHGMPAPSDREALVLRAVPTVERALECGRVDVTGHARKGGAGHYPPAIAPVFAASARRSLRDFVYGVGPPPGRAVVILGDGRPPHGWVARRFVFGTVAHAPGCGRGLAGR